MVKVRDAYAVQVALTLAHVSEKVGEPRAGRFMLWTRRGDRLEYAGTPSPVMIYHLDQTNRRRFHLKAFISVEGADALNKIFRDGLDLSFLTRDAEEYCIQCLISAAGITRKGFVIGVKATTKIVSPPDPSSMEDTLVVAGRVEYWNRLNRACDEFDRQFRSRTRKRKEPARPSSPFGERELPILPPPKPMDDFDMMVQEMMRDRDAWAQEKVQPEEEPGDITEAQPLCPAYQHKTCPAPEEKGPEDYYHIIESPPLSPAYQDETWPEPEEKGPEDYYHIIESPPLSPAYQDETWPVPEDDGYAATLTCTEESQPAPVPAPNPTLVYQPERPGKKVYIHYPPPGHPTFPKMLDRITSMGYEPVAEKSSEVAFVVLGEFSYKHYLQELEWNSEQRGPYDPDLPNAKAVKPGMLEPLSH
jgi:hypothetical protein